MMRNTHCIRPDNRPAMMMSVERRKPPRLFVGFSLPIDPFLFVLNVLLNKTRHCTTNKTKKKPQMFTNISCGYDVFSITFVGECVDDMSK